MPRLLWSWRTALALAVLAAPPVAFGWLLTHPHQDHELVLTTEHAVAVTLISFLAAMVAVLVARVALQLEQYTVALVTLGFLTMGGFFTVHALATPGVWMDAGLGPYRNPGGRTLPLFYGVDGGDVVSTSAFLSLFVPSFFFAASYTPLTGRLRGRLPARAGSMILAVAGLLVLYGWASFTSTTLVADLPLARPPLSYALSAVSGALLGFAAWQQARIYRRTRFPMHGALVLAYLLLAQAQVPMVLSPVWRLSWWEYHLLMLVAVVLALAALFLELDRRRGLERFLPAEVVERVVAGDLLRLAGERRVVTILFADLRGSTSLAERLPAEAVVDLLNAYVGALARCVFAHDGMLDKFLGDGLMAIFGVVPDPTHGAAPAARAARAMRAAVDAVNQERLGRGETTVQFGVGIHTGEVVLGSVGIPQRSDFTAIGDTVNTASRLEGLCKELGVDVVLSQPVAQRLPSDDLALRDLGTAPVRGRSEPLRVFTLA